MQLAYWKIAASPRSIKHDLQPTREWSSLSKISRKHRWIRRATNDVWAHGMKPWFGFFCERGPQAYIQHSARKSTKTKPITKIRALKMPSVHQHKRAHTRLSGEKEKKTMFIKQVICQFCKQMTRMNKSYVCISINYWLQQKCTNQLVQHQVNIQEWYAAASHRKSLHMMSWSLCRWSRPRAPKGNLESSTKFCCPFILNRKRFSLFIWSCEPYVQMSQQQEAGKRCLHRSAPTFPNFQTID
jgi:hypothetical protein